MAIKIQNNTIISDSRVVVDASKVGIGTTNPSPNLFIKEKNRSEDIDYNNWIVSFGSTVSTAEDGPGGVAVDSQGNIYVCGGSETTNTGSFSYRGVLGKFSPSGSLIWQKSITNAGITSGYTSLTGIKVDSNDDVYITGHQEDSLISEKSIFTAKLNSSGDIQWQAQLGVGNSITSDRLYTQGIGIGTTSDVFIVGVTSTANAKDALIAKYNSSGTLQWQKALGIGTNTDQYSWSLGIGSTGKVYLSGDAGISTYRAFVFAFDSAGTLQWQRYIGDSSLDDSSGAVGIGVDSSDNVYITGSESSGTYGNAGDFWIAKFDKTGTLSWQKYITGDSYEYNPSNIEFDSSNNLYFSGVSHSSGTAYPDTGDLVIFKMNSSGDLQWQRSMGATDYEDHRWEAPNNTAVYGDKVIVAGFTYSIPNVDGQITLASLTTDGDFIGSYGPYFKAVESNLTVGISTWTVGVSTLTVDTSTLNTTAFAIGIETGISTSTLYPRLQDYITPTAEIQGTLKVNSINFNSEDGNLGIGTTTPVSKLSVAGTITEYTDDQYWNLVSDYDIGTDANQVPLNQFLGKLAFLDRVPSESVGNGYFIDGDKVISENTTIANNKINVALEGDIIVATGKTFTISTGSTVVLNPFDFETSSVDELLIHKTLRVGVTSTFDVVTSGIASVNPNSTSLIGFGTVTPPNIAAGLLVKEIPGIIAAGTTVVSFTSGTPTNQSTVTISKASINTGFQTSITFKFGNFGEERSSIILDGETGLIKSSSNTILIDGEENKITINDMVLDASEDGTLEVSYNNNLRFRAGNDGYFRLGTSLSGGIQFNGDTAAANALDDYEEGTWTPTVVGSSTAGTATYGSQTARYTKIGRLVYVELYISWTGGTGTGDLVIAGLPFTSANVNTYAPMSVSSLSNIALTANNVLTIEIVPNNTRIAVWQTTVGGGAAGAVTYDAAGGVAIGGCYTV